MQNRTFVQILFGIAAIYDGILGLIFLLAPGVLFARMGVTPPNHFGYVHFPAALLLIFTVMFIAVAMSPEKNRNLIPYGMLLKVAYSGVVFWHWLTTGIPDMWKAFAVADLAFLALFIMAFRWTRREYKVELLR